MRMIYIDPGLTTIAGHHAEHCRAIKAATLARGHAFDILAYREIPEKLRAELGAVRCFRCGTFVLSEDELNLGFLDTFRRRVDATREDLEKVGGFRDGDIIYVSSAQPFLLSALTEWARDRPRPPSIFVEVCTDPGALLVQDNGQTHVQPLNFRATLWQHAGACLAALTSGTLRVVGIDPCVSALYAALLRHEVITIPHPLGATEAGANRAGRRPITVGVAGAQRPEKGYQFMPEVIRRSLDRGADIRFLLHTSSIDAQPETQEALRALARSDSRVELDERAVSRAEWMALMTRIDLMLCPYDPVRYAQACSAIAVEAISNATPIVVPAPTTMSHFVHEHEEAGLCYEGWSAEPIAAALLEAVSRYDDLAGRAARAAQRYVATQGSANLVAKVLALCGAA